MLTNLPSLTLDHKQKSTTQVLSPTYRKLTGVKFSLDSKNSQTQSNIEAIHSDYSNISFALDNLQTTLNQRMSVHERQLLAIMKIQIGKMLEDVRKVVKVFNQMIKEKNFSQDLWQTKNEVQYFKFEAFRLFQQNKSLKRQLSTLKQQIQSLNFQQKCQSIALKKLAKRLVKQKAKRNSSAALLISDKKSIEKSQQQTVLSPLRKRHESLSSNIKEVMKTQTKLNTEDRSLEKRRKQHIQSTISYSDKERKKLMTEAEENLSLVFNNAKIRGYSERIMLFNNQGRSDKLKLFKQKASLYKNKNLDEKIEQQQSNTKQTEEN